ncbi:hypothetical protein [Mangrovibrevibacter kandeliae]|uniref:hypothetical protein n=1 Tax=Mangrovibrevibacter kandeliae TaxID=2968473 RepID=UPI00211798FF|nr:hypothetical protein [Aurantimonas sp. CSK15Z-1]MCQ8783184.1 hypothetical protein [Aurantimonas sp. CSK15Z-1]
MIRLCLVAAATLCAGGAGPREPTLMRSVVMDGMAGAAYYSHVEGGYRFVQAAGHAEPALAVSSLSR